MSAFNACVNAKLCRLISFDRDAESSVSVIVTCRLATAKALSAVLSTATEKLTPVVCPPGSRPTPFGESRIRIALAPGPDAARVAVTSV